MLAPFCAFHSRLTWCCFKFLLNNTHRHASDRYTKLADWDYISQCARAAAPIPFAGNGDILSWEDANRGRDGTGISSVMIGRGALIKPWIFKEIEDQQHYDIRSGLVGKKERKENEEKQVE